MNRRIIQCIIVVFSFLIASNVYAEEVKTQNIRVYDAPVLMADTNYNNVTNSQQLKCSSLGSLMKDIQGIFNVFKIAVPIIVVFASTYDFIKAVATKVEGETKTAFQRLLKRLLFAMVLFFIPNLINFFLGLIDPSYSSCVNI